MFGSIGGPEMLVVLVVALLVFGPRKLPELARGLGNALHQLRRASNEFRHTLEKEVRDAEKEVKKALPDAESTSMPGPGGAPLPEARVTPTPSATVPRDSGPAGPSSPAPGDSGASPASPVPGDSGASPASPLPGDTGASPPLQPAEPADEPVPPAGDKQPPSGSS